MPFLHQHRTILICLVLVVATLAVYWQVQNHDFVNLDDSMYVFENRYVEKGFTRESVSWAFTNTVSGMWIPLTWLSFMAGSHFFGISPGWHHLTNVFIHLANALLLLFLLRRMTGDFWQSVFVAALFALHPMHVESVAWISERKDVLSALFFFLTLWGYSSYVERPSLRGYLLVLLFFLLGLMAKPMLVTLPFVLILIDYWPLDRFKLDQVFARHGKAERLRFIQLVLEKIPLCVVALAVSAVTFAAHQKAGGIYTLEALPIDVRMTNVFVSYLKYIGKLFYPANLAVLYPYPHSASLLKCVVAFLFLGGTSWLLFRNVRKYPYLLVGWLWYLGVLVPVIGFVHAGSQAMADRFVYIPFVGLYIAIAWGVPQLMGSWAHRNLSLAVLSMICAAILIAASWNQVRYWQNSLMLFGHALRHTSNNWIINGSLANALDKEGRTDEAITYYFEALRIEPNYWDAHYNLGNALDKIGRTDEAIKHYLEALRIEPDHEKAHNNLGIVLDKTGYTDEAIKHYLEALRIKPDYEEAHNNLGIALYKTGRTDEAIKHYLEALRTKPDFVHALNNLGSALDKKGRTDDAIKHYLEALRIKPDYEEAHNNLGNALDKIGSTDEAIKHYLEALRIKPD
ncbi:MAG: tetratricopeptide repeat protein, partial [Deltaproteobacteria bacterium]|nr:tetratricopeptide repeat protein [Deltaproteobacteria bacterium]